MTQQNQACAAQKSQTHSGRLQLTGKIRGGPAWESGRGITPAQRAIPEPWRGCGASVWVLASPPQMPRGAVSFLINTGLEGKRPQLPDRSRGVPERGGASTHDLNYTTPLLPSSFHLLLPLLPTSPPPRSEPCEPTRVHLGRPDLTTSFFWGGIYLHVLHSCKSWGGCNLAILDLLLVWSSLLPGDPGLRWV